MTDDHLDNTIALLRETLMTADFQDFGQIDDGPWMSVTVDTHFIRSWLLALFKERKRRRLAGPALRIERARKAFS